MPETSGQRLRPGLLEKARQLAVLIETASDWAVTDDLFIETALAGDTVIRDLCGIRAMSLGDLQLKLDAFFRVDGELWDAQPLLRSVATDLQAMIDEPREKRWQG